MSIKWGEELEVDASRALSVLQEVQKGEKKQQCKQSLVNASGVAFMCSFRMGVGITLGGGRGFVMGRLPDGRWSAPLFLMVDQAGVGISLGMTEVQSLIVLDKPQLAEWFAKEGVGLSAEATLAEPVEGGGKYRNLNDLAHEGTFRFSVAHGAIVDFSAQGSHYQLAHDKNTGLYGQAATVQDILGGQVETPTALKEVQAALDQIINAA
jgi:sodium-coupled neutral amino acid transporter 10